jgi:hypothetical protein
VRVQFRVAALAAISLLFAGLAVTPSPARAAPNCPGSAPTDPCLTLTPGSGPVGTHVRVTGRITRDLANVRDQFHNPSYFALIHEFDHGFPGHPGECELLVGAGPFHLHLTASGLVSGSFIVGKSGGCFQEDGSDPTQPGRYGLVVGCHACTVASFQITGGLPFTGEPTGWLATAGLLMLVCGSAIVLSARPRPST